MARINIEDSIKTDIRFINLAIKLGSIKLALGELTWAWISAQKYYLSLENERCIPHEEWQKQECNNLLIEVGLAESRAKGVWMRGADDQFGWLLQRQQSGSLGGKKKAERRSSRVNQEHNEDNHHEIGDEIQEADKRPLENDDENLATATKTHTISSDRVASFLFPLSSEEEESTGIEVTNVTSSSVAVTSSPQPRSKSARSVVNVFSEAELSGIIPLKIQLRWAELYPDPGYLHRQLIRAFAWYELNGIKKPKTVRGWCQALGSWFEKGWTTHLKTLESKKPVGYSHAELELMLGGQS